MSKFKKVLINELNEIDNKSNNLILGENNHPCYAKDKLNNVLLTLFDSHFQGISEINLRNYIRNILIESKNYIIKENNEKDGIDLIINLFVLCFNTRWCRGGKGAKLAFYQAIKFLYEIFPIPVIKLLPLIPEFGYWKDLLLLLQHIKDFPVPDVDYTSLQSAVWDLYAQQLMLDYSKLQSNNNNNYNKKSSLKSNLELGISCAGKYAPRENKQFDNTLHAVSELCKRMFPDNINNNDNNNINNNDDIIIDQNDNNDQDEEDDEDDDDMVILKPEDIGLVENENNQTIPSLNTSSTININSNSTKIHPKKKYREIITSLNRALDVVEVKMCGNQFSSINMAAVPSRCMSMNQAAFANEKLDGNEPELPQGNRHPDNPDRIKCRQNLLKVLSSKGPGVKGAQRYPHEYVDQVLNNKSKLTLSNKLVINSQWQSMRESIEEMVRKRKETILANEILSDSLSNTQLNKTIIPSSSSTTTPNNVGLGNLIPLSDVSGSMAGTPMSVAIGLGILCSELVHESFRDLVLTFSGSASWENLSNCHNFVDKVNKLKRAHWEGSTNFYNALKQISDIVLKYKLKQEEIPNLLVISDMQFDMASGLNSSYSYSYNYSRSSSSSKNWNTVYENIEKLYSKLGMDICGIPYTPPIIIFWNVRANAVGFPVTADQKGVMTLSGYSPALMKFILSGEFEQEVIEEVPQEKANDQGEEEEIVMISKKRKIAVSPAEVLTKILHEDKFDCIRQILNDPSISCHLSVRDYEDELLLNGCGSTSDPLIKPTKKHVFKSGIKQNIPQVPQFGRRIVRGGRGSGGRGRGRGGGRGRR